MSIATKARWPEPAISYNEGVERAVLGAVLLDPSVFPNIKHLRDSDFWLHKHRAIWRCICELASQGRTPDEVAVFDWLTTHGQENAADFLGSLAIQTPPDYLAALRQWANTLLEHASRRAHLEVAYAHAQASQDRNAADVVAEIFRQESNLATIQARMRDEGSVAPEHQPLGVSMADVETENFSWLWHGRVALGKITTFDGDGGVGKSLATLDLAARVAMGRAMPDGAPGLGMPAGVILICGEDGLADTVKPRLLAAGTSPEALDRIQAVNGVPERLADGTLSERLISLLADLPALEATIMAKRARLLIVDPITAYLGNGVDMNKDAEVRRVLTPLARMAEKFGIAVGLVRHLNRAHGAAAQHRGLGSVGFLNVARLGLLFAPNPDTEGEVLVSRYKGNIGAPPPTLAYLIEQVGDAENMPRISWLGERETTAQAALAAQTGASTDNETRSATDEAVEWLRSYLANGPRPADEVTDEAAKAGIISDNKHDKPLRAARARVGINMKNDTIYREGGIASGGRWMWRYDPLFDTSLPEGYLRKFGATEQATNPESNSPAPKIPTPENGERLSGEIDTKMSSEGEAGYLSTTSVFEGHETSSEHHTPTKIPWPGDGGKSGYLSGLLDAQESPCPECGRDDSRIGKDELGCAAAEAKVGDKNHRVEREEAYALARMLDWPRVTVGPATTCGGSEASWRTFTDNISPAYIDHALKALRVQLSAQRAVAESEGG